MKIVATIQARMGSTRLPGKVLKDICGKPMLLWQVERIKRSRLIDDVIIATTTSSIDDEIVQFCIENNIKYFRGSEDDVLNRVASLIQKFGIDLHAEFCGDSPLPDPQLIDEFIGYYLKNQDNFDYVSSSMETTYPPGQEITLYRGITLIELNEFMFFLSSGLFREQYSKKQTLSIEERNEISKASPIPYLGYRSNKETYINKITVSNSRKIFELFSKTFGNSNRKIGILNPALDFKKFSYLLVLNKFNVTFPEKVSIQISKIDKQRSIVISTLEKFATQTQLVNE